MSGTAEKPIRQDWERPLGEMEKALLGWLDQVRTRQKAFEENLLSSRGNEAQGSSWPQALDDAFRGAQQLQEIADRGRDKVAEVEAALADGEAGLREWLESAGAARGKLATWLGGAIG